jgi:hypothetical protein
LVTDLEEEGGKRNRIKPDDSIDEVRLFCMRPQFLQKTERSWRMKMDNFGKMKLLLGIYLVAAAVVLAFFILSYWPVKGGPPGLVTVFGKDYVMDPDVRLIFLVLLAGALGSFVHSATSFVDYVGNRSLTPSWMWWYVLRPFIGMGIAAVFYFLIRGGLFVLSATSDMEKNAFGVVAIAALSGMFSKQATDKLGDIFDNFFKTEKGKGDEKRGDKLEETKPVKDLMIGMNKITYHKMGEGKTEKDVTIQELYEFLKKGKGLTRIPILNQKGAVKYIIHQSMLYKYISAKSIDAKEPINIGASTLEEFLKFEDMSDLVAKSLAFVSKNATLGDAKAAMEKTKNCQDVFVTENGTPDEPILGWLTNTEISKHAKG